MSRNVGARLALVVLAVWAGIGAPPIGADGGAVAASEATGRLHSAMLTQAATRGRLQVLSAASCAGTAVVSYRRSDVEAHIADQWYVASQLWADAVLLRAVGAADTPTLVSFRVPGSGGRGASRAWSVSEARCYLDKAFAFLGRLWDPATGGYYPRSNPAGTRVERQVRYADDNALAGLALLAAAESVPAAERERYLHAARLEGHFLTESGRWDDTFGGGFWWNTNRGDTDEGKPAQTNALAALFFARLHAVTGDEAAREWSLRTLFWLDTYLYDPDRQLYRWSMRYGRPGDRLGDPIMSERYFNYDQGIAIQAEILATRLDGDPARLDRARDVGRALHRDFWGVERGGYNLQAGVEQVYASYAAWASLGHLALYDADGDGGWLDLARANADALAATLGEADGGYAYRHYGCAGRRAPGCQDGRASWAVDRTRDGAAQAWMQHLQTALAQRLAIRDQALETAPEPSPGS